MKTAPASSSAGSAPARIRTVIVDDEPAARRGLRLMLDRDPAVPAGMAQNLEAADDPLAEQAAIVQPVLCEDIFLERLQIVFSEKLTGEELRADV